MLFQISIISPIDFLDLVLCDIFILEYIMEISAITNKDQLKNFVDQIETLEHERTMVSENLKEVYDKAADAGIDKKALKQVVKNRKCQQAEIDHHQELVETYMSLIEG